MGEEERTWTALDQAERSLLGEIETLDEQVGGGAESTETTEIQPYANQKRAFPLMAKTEISHTTTNNPRMRLFIHPLLDSSFDSLSNKCRAP